MRSATNCWTGIRIWSLNGRWCCIARRWRRNWRGRADDAKRRLEEFGGSFRRRRDRFAGRTFCWPIRWRRNWRGANIVRVETGDSWLTVGGDESRGRICTSTVKPGARLYAIPLMRFNWNQIPDNSNRQQMQNSDDEQRKRGAGLGILPVVDKGEMFFQDNTRIYAMDLDGGVPLPAWVDTYPMQNGAYKAPGNPPPSPLGKQLCVSVNDKYVVAVMGLSDPLARRYPVRRTRIRGWYAWTARRERNSGRSLRRIFRRPRARCASCGWAAHR